MIVCMHPRNIQGIDRSDHYASKSSLHARKEGLFVYRKKESR